MVKKIGGSKVTYSFRKSSKYGMVSAAIGVLAIIGATHAMASESKVENNVVVNEKVEVKSNVEVIPVEKKASDNAGVSSVEKKESTNNEVVTEEKKASTENDNKLVAKSEVGFDSDNNDKDERRK